MNDSSVRWESFHDRKFSIRRSVATYAPAKSSAYLRKISLPLRVTLSR